VTNTVQKITLSASRDIPFNKLVLSQSNVRRIKAGVAIEELAEDIARHTLLQSLTVRPMLDGDGAETGMFEIPAGGRRFRALELLVKQRRLSKTTPIPCVIRTEGIAEEDSLAENVQRAPLHPLDQFRAFLALREKGQSEEEIAAAFFVAVAVVKQRLRLASVSPKLLDVYAEDGMTLDQLMAFTVSCDHERQEQVFERLTQSYSKEPYTIRRMLTETAIRAYDKRARFIGLEAYQQAGGTVMRDLFTPDEGGWLQDPALLDRLVAETLTHQAEAIRAEGWRWIEVAPEFPYGHSFGLRQVRGEPEPLSAEEDRARAASQAENDRLEAEHAQAEELPEDVDRRLGELETALAEFENRPMVFDPEELVRAGAFVSIDPDGGLRVERGYVRPEDELPIAAEPQPEEDVDESEPDAPLTRVETYGEASTGEPVVVAEPEEDEGLKPIPDRLITELTAHRTLALRDAIGERPDVAYLACLHALCLQIFYHYAVDSCVEVTAKSAVFTAQAPGLNDSPSARSVEGRQKAWAPEMPKDPADLWDVLSGYDDELRGMLFAHCVGQTVNAVHEGWNRRPRALAHADKLAEAVDLDMTKAGWTATADSFLGRVTKARILQAVREGRSEADAERISGLKKDAMVEEGARLLAGSGWLPEPLRTPVRAQPVPVESVDPVEAEPETESTGEETAADGGEWVMAEEELAEEDGDTAFEPHAIAAE